MVTENILEITLRHAEKAGAESVTDLYLVIGDLSSVIDDSVQFYWDFIAEGTIAHGAKLHFRRVPAEFYCSRCDSRFGMDETLCCPNCRGNQISVIAGQEFYLEAMDIGHPASSNEFGIKAEENS